VSVQQAEKQGPNDRRASEPLRSTDVSTPSPEAPRVVRQRQSRTPEPTGRKRPKAVIALLAAVAVLGVGAVVFALTHQSGGDAGAAGTTGSSASGSSASGSSKSGPSSTSISTTTTAPPNDLLAPPPTVVTPIAVTNGLAPQVSRVDTTDRVIFITIDDGQIRDPSYLDHFAQMGVPFTSFLTEPMAKADPEFWKGTEARGGRIQAHTITHPNLRVTAEAKARTEICQPADTFTGLFGTRPTLFRPPYGNSNDMVRRIAAECGYKAVVLWKGSTNDGKLTMQDVTLHPGDIILMHYRKTLNADLDDVVARARAEGFRIARLEDYLAPG